MSIPVGSCAPDIAVETYMPGMAEAAKPTSSPRTPLSSRPARTATGPTAWFESDPMLGRIAFPVLACSPPTARRCGARS